MTRAFWDGFVRGNVMIGQFLVDNARGLLVVVGAAWLYHGVAGFSVPAANMLGGVLVMALGAYPYLLRKRKV